MEHRINFSDSSRSKASRTLLALSGVIGILCVVAVVSYYQQPSLSTSVMKQFQFEEQEFNNYIEKFNKAYSHEEYAKRFYIFTQNAAFIRLHNSLNKSWTLGYNDFTDLSPEEFKARYLVTYKNTPTPKNTVVYDTSLKFPASIDWRSQGAVTSVGNQGTCTAGWAFAVTGAIEGLWKIAGNPLVSLSEEQLVSCSFSYGNHGCGGGIPDFAYEYIIGNEGIATDKIYPWTSANSTVNNCIPTLASNVAAKISSYNNVSPVDDPAGLLAAILQQPVVVGVEADQYVWQYYRTGVISNNCGTNINHYALVVGYNTTASTSYYIVKNSWGSGWGMDGYLNIAIGSGQGVCGIQMVASVPTL